MRRNENITSTVYRSASTPYPHHPHAIDWICHLMCVCYALYVSLISMKSSTTTNNTQLHAKNKSLRKLRACGTHYIADQLTMPATDDETKIVSSNVMLVMLETKAKIRWRPLDGGDQTFIKAVNIVCVCVSVHNSLIHIWMLYQVMRTITNASQQFYH